MPAQGTALPGTRNTAIRGRGHSEDYTDAERLLAVRAGEVASGTFQGLSIEKTTVGGLLDDVLTDYEVNGKPLRFARNAIDNHLRKFFAGRRAVSVTTSDVKRYIVFRRSSQQGTRTYRGRLPEAKQIPIKPGKNATINRELALLKHAFYLGLKHTPPKVARVPHIPLLEERNVRRAFSSMSSSSRFARHSRPILCPFSRSRTTRAVGGVRY